MADMTKEEKIEVIQDNWKDIFTASLTKHLGSEKIDYLDFVMTLFQEEIGFMKGWMIQMSERKLDGEEEIDQKAP
jgi:hypothetical protein